MSMDEYVISGKQYEITQMFTSFFSERNLIFAKNAYKMPST